ncbi:hypothetical protein LPJ75_000813, partial [Coemansia sp. RSA 2598]
MAMLTAYKNNIAQHFGEHLNRAVNCILSKKEMERDLRHMPNGPEHDAFRRRCEEEVWMPARQVKAAFARRKYSDPTLCPRAQYVLHLLEPVLDAYAPDYEFHLDSRFADVKLKPQMHFQAFYELARFFEIKGYPSFNCFPLRTSWVPAHTTIDTHILYSQILKRVLGKKERKQTKPEDYWSTVLDRQSHPLRTSGGKVFSGVMATDAISACPIFENAAAKAKKQKAAARRAE